MDISCSCPGTSIDLEFSTMVEDTDDKNDEMTNNKKVDETIKLSVITRIIPRKQCFFTIMDYVNLDN